MVELLVVIAVIAILAGLLLPALARAKMTARAAVCKSNMRQIQVAYVLYQDDHQGRGNIMWADGHATSARRGKTHWDEAWYLGQPMRTR